MLPLIFTSFLWGEKQGWQEGKRQRERGRKIGYLFSEARGGGAFSIAGTGKVHSRKDTYFDLSYTSNTNNTHTQQREREKELYLRTIIAIK